jgi:predicted DsbA family dithiol-disulfide isomerase
MEVAMDSLKDKIEFRVRWEPFLLKPDIPADGIPKPAAYTDPSNPR